MMIRNLLDRFRRPAEAERMIEDGFLGRLTWYEAHRGWRGMMTMANGETAPFTIDGAKTDESVPAEVRDMVKLLAANEPLIRDRVAVSMSEFYNGTWGGGDTITPEEMARRITLTNVSLYEEGGGELFYKADGELFTDHTICVPLEADGEIGEPELAG